jgi:triosephosphate isomerase
MRRIFIAGNWKMNKTASSTMEFIEKIKELKDHENVEAAIIAPYVYLMLLKENLKDSNLKVGAQNVYFQKEGAFTGEISPKMLKDIDLDYCIVGHSERRELFYEKDSIINKKIKALLEVGVKPILCVGENLEIRKKGMALSHVKGQLEKCLMDLDKNDISDITIAYEPIWAIGTGETATPNQAEEVCKFIREFIKENYDENTAENVIIQYGGSVNQNNAEEILGMPNIDGALVGGASLDASKFSDICSRAFFIKKH